MDHLIEVDVIETWWDYIIGGVTVILTGINAWLIYIIYTWQHKDSNVVEERQRRVRQFNNIFLVPRIDYLKGSFDELLTLSSEFETSTDNDDKKQEIHDKVDNKIVEFEEKFVNYIEGLDSLLFDDVHNIVEGMRDGISNDVFDTNTKEITGAAYVQKIQTRINSSYKALLKSLFGYDGNLKENKNKELHGANTCLYIMLGVIIILLGSLVIRNFDSKTAPEKVVFQLDSAQMNTIVNAVQNDTLKKSL